MDINSMTIGDARELAAMFGKSQNEPSSIYSKMIGKYVIVRSSNEGINAGYVEAADSSGVLLKDSRRIWYHKPKDKTLSWYEGVALSGLSDDSKVSATVKQKCIAERYSMTLCEDVATQSIQAAVPNAQS